MVVVKVIIVYAYMVERVVIAIWIEQRGNIKVIFSQKFLHANITYVVCYELKGIITFFLKLIGVHFKRGNY